MLERIFNSNITFLEKIFMVFKKDIKFLKVQLKITIEMAQSNKMLAVHNNTSKKIHIEQIKSPRVQISLIRNKFNLQIKYF
jgi:hypothetical protein